VTYPCPFCRATADPATGCPGCGRAPDPDAAEVVRLDVEIPVLTARLAAAREAVTGIDAQLRDAWTRRQSAAARVRAAVAANRPVLPAPAPAPVATPATGRTPEASTKVVQNVLFLLGGLLLGIAAIVFTAVAWTTFGVGGRAALLAGFTAAALAVPPIAVRRSLSATGETFAAVGLLLLLLDGYGAWSVDLFGVTASSGWGYTGAVCAVTAAVAVGYAHLTGLIGPRFAALLIAQPVLPLLLATVEPVTPEAWSFLLAALAAVNLAVVHVHRDRGGPVALSIRLTAYAFGALAAFGSGICALAALGTGTRPGDVAVGAAALITLALVLVAAAVSARSTMAQACSGGVLVVATAVGAGRIGALLDDYWAPVAVGVVVALLATAVAATARLLPAGVRRGPWIGALATVAVPALVAFAAALDCAVRVLDVARPAFAANPLAMLNTGATGIRLPLTITLLAAAFAVLLPRRVRLDIAVIGAALAALAAPVGLGLPWWCAPILDLTAAAVALAVAMRASTAAVPGLRLSAPRPPPMPSPAAASLPLPVVPAAARHGLPFGVLVAAVLVVHGAAVGYGLPGVAALTLGATVLLCLGVAVAGRGNAARRVVAGPALTAGLLAVPALAAAVAATVRLGGFDPAPWQAVDLSRGWQARAALGALMLIAAVPWLISSARSWYRMSARAAVFVAAATAPLWAFGGGDSVAVYASVALLVIALTHASTRPPVRAFAVVAAVLPGIAFLVAAAGSLLAVLVVPYEWLGWVWVGRPAGTGISPTGYGSAASGAAVGLLLVAAAIAVIAGRTAVSVLAVAVPVAVLAADAPWPAVPLVSLVVGLGLGLVWAVTGMLRGASRSGFVLPVFVVPVVAVALAGAGTAGMLATHAMTLVALGAVGVSAAVVGVSGRALAARLAGWLTAVGAAIGFAVTVGRAVELTLAGTAFGVLAVAAVAVALGSLLVRRRPVEGAAVQAAAHAGAVVALLLAVGSARHAAALCTLWGLVVGVRALLPGESANRRRLLVVAAAATELLGWWVLVGSQRVSVVEAYTLPAAVVTLLAGWLALRSRSELSSWTAYGPALGAALLPSLATVLIGGDGDLLRRLLLGVGALAVLLLGAYTRLQAPVVLGGGALLVVALHELALVWELVPRWIPLALGGLLLVGLAMTLERRRRDLARVRAAVARMS
jgi:hypothetical protein